MAHLDLYSALGLDRSVDYDRLAADIDNRLSSCPPGDVLSTELSLARAVLGDPYRRSLYDRQLADPSAPDITMDAIRQLAEYPAPPVTDAGPPAQRYSGATAGDKKGNRPVWLAATAATAALALAVAAVVWIMSPPGADENASADRAPAASSAGVDATGTAGTPPAPTTSTTPTTTSATPVAPVGVASAPKSSHHGDADRNAGEDICGGRVCDTAVLHLSAPVSAEDLTFTQSYDMPLTTITASHPAFTEKFTTEQGDVTNSEYISGVTAYSDGDGEIHIALTNASGTPTFHPHLLPDGERLVIDISQ